MTHTIGDDLSVDRLSPERADALVALPWPEGARASDPAFAECVARLADIFCRTVCVAERTPAAWQIVTESVIDRPAPDAPALPALLHDASGSRVDIRLESSPEAGTWTILPLPSRRLPRRVLMIAGDWRLSSPALRALAARIRPLVDDRPVRLKRNRTAARLADRLTRVRGLRPVSQLIVTAMVRGVGARLGAIAVAEEGQRRLAIRATHGYSLLLTEHLRFQAGDGILGQVLQTGKVVLGGETDEGAARAPRRPRYRTNSFIAVPLRSGDEIIAVVSVADPLDGDGFEPRDVALLQALAAPAALALARERAVARAETYAHAAAIDPVSGLFNRRYFHIRIQEEIQRAQRHQIPVALLMIDLDDFKHINDTYGHLVGDSVLRETAEILRRSVRVFDVCTRFGGEEFAIIMPGSSAESAAAVAERIRERVEAYRDRDAQLAGLTVTVSIGLAVSRPGVMARDLVSHADQALYLAKRGGKNQVRALD